MTDQSKRCWFCGKYSSVEGIDLHHAVKRSLDPSRVDDPENKVPLCRTCHEKTESSPAFYRKIQDLWNRRLPSNK